MKSRGCVSKGEIIMATGVIYVMTTAVDGLIKIGKTDRFASRMNELERDGHRNVTALKRRFAIKVSDYDEKETLLQKIFEKSRVANSELFAVQDINLVIELLKAFQGQIIYDKAEVSNEISEEQPDETVSEPSIEQNNVQPEIRRQAPRTTFAMINVPIGSEIAFVRDVTKCAIVIDDDNHVKYNDDIYSVTALAKKLLNKYRGVNGWEYFLYNGEKLYKRRGRIDSNYYQARQQQQ